MNEIDEYVDWRPEDMVEILLKEPDDFLKVKETLTRMGIPSMKEYPYKLYQSCCILHKQGRYFITHFKEMFMLDGKYGNYTVADQQRRNTIVTLLSDWGLIEVVDPSKIEDKAHIKYIKIVPYRDKPDWELISKYSVGKN